MTSNRLSKAVVAAVNDDDVLSCNLASSPLIVETDTPLIVERGHESASKAYNAALAHVTADVVIFAHQDVYLPRGWDEKLLSVIELLQLQDKNWAVLGVVGVDKAGSLVGGAWSNGWNLKIETEFSAPVPVVSIDELVIVLRRDSKLRFDPNMPAFHLYGTDIVQSALKAGQGAYVFDAPVVHNSLRRIKLGRTYTEAYRYMQLKWREKLPIRTTVLPITRSGWPLFKNWCHEKKRHIKDRFRPPPVRKRHESPSSVAQNVGYE